MKTIAIDFDGVLHTYEGWNGDVPTGEPIDGAWPACQELAKGFRLVVFTTRNADRVKEWLTRHAFNMFDEVTNVKSEFFVLIDDRCIRFNGTWGGLTEHIKHFSPYWKAT